jgi:hypothetical protein
MERIDVVNRIVLAETRQHVAIPKRIYSAVPFCLFNYCENSLIKLICPSKIQCEKKLNLIGAENYASLTTILTEATAQRNGREMLKI